MTPSVGTFLAISIALAALYVLVTYLKSPVIKLIFKGLASLSFVVLAFACAEAATLGPGRFWYAMLMLFGLALGAAGDVLLQMMEVKPASKDHCFQLGLGAFLIGHVFYILTFLFCARFTAVQPIVAVSLFAVLFAAQFPAKLQLGSQRSAVYLYGAVISVMLALAVGMAIYTPGQQSTLIAIGGALFTVSDAVLALILFRKDSAKWMRVLNLGTYYAAQILFAMSLLYR